MDHNVGLTDEQDIAEYLKRDVGKRSTTVPYKIVRDEIVGRWEIYSQMSNIWYWHKQWSASAGLWKPVF